MGTAFERIQQALQEAIRHAQGDDNGTRVHIKMDIEKTAQAIEADAGQSLPDLRQALAEVEQIRVGNLKGCRITRPEQMMVRAARSKLGLSQAEFAARINTPAATLRDWEQGRFPPPGAVLCLLRLLCAHPQLGDELAARAA